MNVNWLLLKVKLSLEHLKKEVQLLDKVDEATKSALLSMRETTEYRIAMNFLQEVLEVKRHRTLARLILRTTQQFDLNASLRMELIDGSCIELDCSGREKVLEFAVLEHARNKAQIVNSKNFSIVNGKRISLLIKNMPVDDLDRYDRLKDIICLLVEAIDKHIANLDRLVGVKPHQLTSMQVTLKELMDAIISIDQTVDGQQVCSKVVISQWQKKLSELLASFELTEKQESELIGFVRGMTDEILDVYGDGVGLHERFQKVIAGFNELLHISP